MYALLALINFLTLKDRRSRRIATVSHGPGPRQVADIYAPRRAGGPWPVIYFLYGGSWTLGERGYYAFVARLLAAAGYLVVVADCRLVPEVEYPAFLEDCAAGLRWTLAHIGDYGGDATRLAVMGHSAGAYNAVMTVLGEAAGTVRAVVGLSGPYDFYPFDVPVSIRVFGAASDPKSTQPVNLVRPGLPPMFLGHGALDRLVQPKNTIALAEALQQAGNEVVERHYPGLGHAWPLLAFGAYGLRRRPVVDDVLEFLADRLGG